MKSHTIRPATREDLDAVFDLVHILAEFEEAANQVRTTLDHYREQWDDHLFHVLVAEIDNKVIGMALYYPTFSTWRGKMMYLEDFVVHPDHRSQGIGQDLFEAYLEDSRRLGAKLCKWQVLDWNEGAIRFYLRNQAKIQKEWYNALIYFDEVS